MFAKIMTLIVGFVVFLVGGAQLEKMFPSQPVTEVWSLSFLILFFIYGYKWAFKTDKKRATRLLSESGFYSNEVISSMSYPELLLRERSHKKDKTVNWSTYTFEQLRNIEAQDKSARKLEKAGTGFIPGLIGVIQFLNGGLKSSTSDSGPSVTKQMSEGGIQRREGDIKKLKADLRHYEERYKFQASLPASARDVSLDVLEKMINDVKSSIDHNEDWLDFDKKQAKHIK